MVPSSGLITTRTPITMGIQVRISHRANIPGRTGQLAIRCLEGTIESSLHVVWYRLCAFNLHNRGWKWPGVV
jgi:hypothetical protein